MVFVGCAEGASNKNYVNYLTAIPWNPLTAA
jgi:hypothetical protein